MSDPNQFDSNPRTQGKVHPLQGEREFFLGYFTKKFFEGTGIKFTTKRIALDDPNNPYAKLHESVRVYPVFVDRAEALQKHYALYFG